MPNFAIRSKHIYFSTVPPALFLFLAVLPRLSILLFFLFSYLIRIYLRFPFLKFNRCFMIFLNDELVILLYLLIYRIILLNLFFEGLFQGFEVSVEVVFD